MKQTEEEKLFLAYATLKETLYQLQRDHYKMNNLMAYNLEAISKLEEQLDQKSKKIGIFQKKNDLKQGREQIQELKQKQEEYQQRLTRYQQKIVQVKEKMIQFELGIPSDWEDVQFISRCEIKNKITFAMDGIPILDVRDFFGKMEPWKNQFFDPETFSFSDMILVHATDIFPKLGMIQKREGEQGIHFTLNGVLPYYLKDAIFILDPLSCHMEKLFQITPQDTFTESEITLSQSAVILVGSHQVVPKEMSIPVIRYEGNPFKAVETILFLMGYFPQSIGRNGFEGCKQNQQVFMNFIQTTVLIGKSMNQKRK